MATTYNTDNQQGAGDEDKKILRKKLSTEFPLSGGETDMELSAIFGSGSEDTEDEAEEKQEFKRRLDVEFPLSGGEGDPV